jgi:hypothetical protein
MSAGQPFQAPASIVGQYDQVQRSVFCANPGLEQLPNNFIYRPSARDVSTGEIEAFLDI